MDQTKEITSFYEKFHNQYLCRKLPCHHRLCCGTSSDLPLLSLPALVRTVLTRLCGLETTAATRSLEILLDQLSHANWTPRFHPAYLRCSARVQALQWPCRKPLLESGLISTMRVHTVKRCHEPIREAREEPNCLYHFKKIHIPRPLNLD